MVVRVYRIYTSLTQVLAAGTVIPLLSHYIRLMGLTYVKVKLHYHISVTSLFILWCTKYCNGTCDELTTIPSQYLARP